MASQVQERMRSTNEALCRGLRGKQPTDQTCVTLLARSRLKFCVTYVAKRSWDVYLIATVMQGYFPDVFVKLSKTKDDIFSGKALLESLLQVSAGLFTRQMSSGPDWLAPQTVEVRNRRGHGERPSESDVLDSLRHMKFVFANFAFPEQHLEDLLKDAQRLVESARRQPGTIETIGVPRASFEKLVLLRALADFERRLEEQAGGFEFQNGTIRFQLPRHWGDKDERSQRIKDQDILTIIESIF